MYTSENNNNFSNTHLGQISLRDPLPQLSAIARSCPPPIADTLNIIRDYRIEHGLPVINCNQGLVRPNDEWIALTRRWLIEAASIVEPWSMSRVAGIAELRQTVADWRNSLWTQEISGKNVLITMGANVAWNLVMKTISDVGDKIAITLPYFFNHFGSIKREMREPVFIDLEFDAETESLRGNYKRALAVKDVRALLISNPHNPTGTHFSREIINEIERDCKKFSSWIVLDESYGAIEQRDSEFTSTGAGINLNTTILIGSVTKSLALGDLRVGYVIAHEDVINKLRGFADDEYICISQAMQFVAAKAIENRSIVHSSVEESLKMKRRALNSLLTAHSPLKLGQGSSAVFGWIKLPNAVDDTVMVRELASKYGVLVTPGTSYGSPGFLRIGYGMCCNTTETERAAQHICSYLLQHTT
jgi:aspartate/methionine/tyrosine aminotransferase